MERVVLLIEEVLDFIPPREQSLADPDIGVDWRIAEVA
jgi:hypothetical protein